jgi:hypothetical protein
MDIISGGSELSLLQQLFDLRNRVTKLENALALKIKAEPSDPQTVFITRDMNYSYNPMNSNHPERWMGNSGIRFTVAEKNQPTAESEYSDLYIGIDMRGVWFMNPKMGGFMLDWNTATQTGHFEAPEANPE